MGEADSNTPGRPAPLRRPRVAVRLVGIASELFITAGALVLLFVVWQLMWTDVVAESEMRGAVGSLESSFADDSTPTDTTPPTTPTGNGNAALARATAILRIPRFGEKYAVPVYEGTDHATLTHGVGHYSSTQGPGELGNFALAGHRTTYGKPFNRIAELRIGDRIVVENRKEYLVYRVVATQVVAPDRVGVLLPVPDHPGVRAAVASLTMTSCHPEFSARERYVVQAELDARYDRGAGLPAAVLAPPGR